MSRQEQNEILSSPLSVKRILVTGGAGYIGSHTCVELLLTGFHVTVLDNLHNSSSSTIDRVRQIVGDVRAGNLVFHRLDLCDKRALFAFAKTVPKFDAAIHFAGHKAVGESVSQPLQYYENNLTSTLNLLALLQQQRCFKLVFSSSATVYGNYTGKEVMISEASPLSPTNPYGRTKLFIEEILRDVGAGAPGKWKIAILRYFNPVGAHESGLIGEEPQGVPNNLMPYILQVAAGIRPHLSVFGGDYHTFDGTCIRDYIHVVDLAKGHVKALQVALFGDRMAADVDEFNLGTGKGTSVLQALKRRVQTTSFVSLSLFGGKVYDTTQILFFWVFQIVLR